MKITTKLVTTSVLLFASFLLGGCTEVPDPEGGTYNPTRYKELSPKGLPSAFNWGRKGQGQPKDSAGGASRLQQQLPTELGEIINV